jgi:hypothetical protein
MAEKEDLGWCVIEQLGHKKLAGYVTEVEIAGAGFLRVDVHGTTPIDPAFMSGQAIATQFIAPSSLYALTPTTESICRRLGDDPHEHDPLDEDGEPW